MCRMTEFYLADFHCVSFMSFLSFCQNKDARRAKAAHLLKGGCRLRLRGLK